MSSNMFRDIHRFHEKFKLPPEYGVGKLPPELMDFRVKFMEEELREFKEAVEKGDKESQLDALVDLVYVALGTAYLCRFPFNSAWDRVQTANMAKVRALSKDQSKRESSYDVVKPPGWKAPTHTDLVQDTPPQMRTFLADIGELDD